MVLSDRAFKVVLHRAISLLFHDECFDVYNGVPDAGRGGLPS